MKMLQVRMLGGFSLEVQGRKMDDSENRSQKPWLLMAYLICNRERTVTQEELMRLCWEGEEKDDPANALRVVLHRTRALLEKLGIGSGMDLIRRTRDGVCWNSCLTLWVDTEEFLCLDDAGVLATDKEKRLECFLKAIDPYRGDFLGRNSGGSWGRYMAEKQRERYIEMALAALEILSNSGRGEEAAALAQKVLGIEPYQESVRCHLMEELIRLGRPAQAMEQYEQLRASLIANFDRVPEEQTQRCYFRALRLCGGESIPVELHRIGEDENRGENGVKVCDFSFFRTFYVSAEYLILQCGLEIYNLLFNIEAMQGKDLSRRTMERAVDALLQQLKTELRRGDTLTQCADHQLLAMVGASGYEEACMLCEIQVKKFYQTYPNFPVRVRYGVWRVGGEKVQNET